MKNIFFIFMFTAVAFIGCTDDDDDLLTGEISSGVELLPDPKPNDIVNHKLFEIINLDYPGLEKVKSFYEAGEHYYAANALLEYYRNRTNTVNPNINLINPTISDSDQRIAEQALEYRFYVRNFYESKDEGTGVFTYYSFWDESTKKINWTAYQNEVSDQEFKYQRHRHQWMLPQAKAYRISKDERYIQSWIEVYSDWLATYPYEAGTQFPPAGGSQNDVDYEWKGLQVAERVLSQIDIMAYFIQSPNFTPEWLSTFLTAFEKEVECIRLNYYQDGNILITQAQAVATAGILMPEFKNADLWTTEGLQKISTEMVTQFNEDGVQFELDLSYHIAAISDFREIYMLAQANNKTNLLPADYISKLKKATEFVMDMIYPNYTIDNFNDTRSSSYAKSTLLNRLKEYSAMYPNDNNLLWMSTEGKSGGNGPTYLTKAYDTSGYYILRNGWTKASTMMILKNNSYSEWHSQPDNGTFGLYRNDRNFFPDAGVFAYSGSDRTKYAATKNHNTMTVNSKSITDDSEGNAGSIEGKCLQLKSKNNYVVLVTENPSFKNITHRRAVFFVNNEFFVIVDEGYKENTLGNVKTNLNFHIINNTEAPSVFEDKIASDGYCQAYTIFSDNNNMVSRTFAETSQDFTCKLFKASDNVTNVSNAIGQENTQLRMGYQVSLRQPKRATTNEPITAARYITVIHPITTTADIDKLNIEAQFTDNKESKPGTFHPEGASVTVTIDNREYNLSYEL